MQVAFRGNFLPDVEPPEERWSTECQVAHTLEAMGHEVLRLQENAVGWDVVEHLARHSDLFLWTTTWNKDPVGALRTLARLRKASIPSVSMHLDLYWGLKREAQLREHPFFRSAHVFTADGGHDREFAELGINHHWLQPAIYAPDAVVGQVQGEYECQIAFVGSYPYPHPEHAPARAQIVHFCQSQFSGFRLWRGGVRGQALADLYASAKIVMGDSCLAGKVSRYFSDRIPETLGRGGFLIHPHVEGIEEHYQDGKHLRLYEAGDFFQLRSLIRHYLDPANDEERRSIALAGREHVLAQHTYRHRLEELLDVVGRTSLKAAR